MQKENQKIGAVGVKIGETVENILKRAWNSIQR
jgi:hypothetical protein